METDTVQKISRRGFLGKAIVGGTALCVAGDGKFGAFALEAGSHQRSVSAIKASDTLCPLQGGSVRLEGWIGQKIDQCLNQRVMKQSVESVVEPFVAKQDGDGGWRGEFWGKWFTSAVLGYDYAPTAQYRDLLNRAVKQLLKAQSPAGYIGACDQDHQLADWDLWGRKYVMLGLIAFYDQTGSIEALTAARREADFLMTQVGPGETNVADACIGVLKGLSSSSILEPIVLLYQRTADDRYLAFARYIVGQWSLPSKFAPQGMLLIEAVMAGKPPLRIDAPKGYEMMSCFEGLCELYRATGEARYLDAAGRFAESVRKTEVMVNGSCSNQELWCNGAITQTAMLEQPQETCVTATWMKLCYQLLRLSGDAKWADELEVSLYNALAGAMMPDGRWWAYFSPLTGQRVASQIQYCGLSCCVANGPRALLLTPRWATMQTQAGPVINLYAPGRSQLKLVDGTSVTLTQTTDYPVSGNVSILVATQRQSEFVIQLRIPSWSESSKVMVNGTEVVCTPGTYLSISRPWKSGDRIDIEFNLAARAVPAPSGAPELTVMRGPIVLALDNRFTPAQEVAVHLVVDPTNGVTAIAKRVDAKDVWMAFDVTFEVRPSHFFGHHPVTLTMVDFASAGNQWSDTNLFRTWLSQPLYLSEAYPQNTWKLMFPSANERPSEPST